MSEVHDAYERVTTGYYRVRDAQLAEVALRGWLGMLARCSPADHLRMLPLLYLFARIRQVTPEARSTLDPVLRAYAGPHVELATRILDGVVPDALALPIEGPVSLDLLWAEFFVTGQAEPIRRIISTLDWPDIIRTRLDAWVNERSWFGGAKRRACAEQLAAVGMRVDLEQARIVTGGDLDCLTFSIAERSIKIFPMLPFQISEAEVISLSTKASAVWSLRLNAPLHEMVAQVCRDETTRSGGLARLLIGATGPATGKPFAL